ncbi:sensor histidine kinase [Paenibacillus endoradicis]|uniref:sensor histidine kinase n=1 Tax=Paenibacillus endoradicis TaxID=2972487 RepID=UPI0021593896|nr:sensor histidine kinase [Paenibacillus endoradicis]MCR8660494.1 histidine kinase [Paenibacillus endoradicis]
MDHLSVDINRIFSNAIQVMETSKYQIYEVCESARDELRALEKELEQVLQQTVQVIEEVDKLELEYRYARIRLTEVSREFNRYGEQDIKRAYEKATLTQLQLATLREQEKHLKLRRDDLQIRVRNVEKNIERAETIASQMHVVLDYLSGDMDHVTRILESAKNRQLLGLKIILAQEDERKRIAREIHDGPAQSLANIVLRTEIAERMLMKEEYPLVQTELTDLKGQVRTGIEEIRKIIFNLRPMALDDLGLIPTLRKLTQDFEEKSKIHTIFEVFGKELRLNSSMEAAIYRLVQEALSNVMKHAEATRVSVGLVFQQDNLRLSMKDNGKGFRNNPNLNSADDRTHYGLIGMYERVELIEGTIDIQSEVGRGTEINIVIPLTTT